MNILKPFLASLISASIALTPAMASPIAGEPGQVFFRYKANMTFTDVPDTQGKDVTAFYVAGVGVSFGELLPLKPEWQDDTWTVVSGTLPEGITFNGATRRFEGVPTAVATAQSVDLIGIDSNGNQVATARATFDVYDVIGQPIPIDFYAHTGKYRFDQIAVPSGLSIYSWDYILDAPPGVTASGPFLEGTPSTAGKYNLFGYGKDYNNKIVATFFGPYLVEDEPTFPFVADMVYPLPKPSSTYDYLQFAFGPTPVNRAIDPTVKPRYFIELDSGEVYPGSVASNNDAKNLLVEGNVWEPYQTAKARWRAIDSDGVEGRSDWFRFGSSYPQPECNPNKDQVKSSPILFKTGKPNSIPMPRPVGTAGTVSFAKIEGSFPEGISMDPVSGLLTGTPVKANEMTEFRIRVDVANPEGTVSTECHYFTKVLPATVGIVDTTDEQAKHVRIGDIYSGSIAVNGGIPNYTVSFTDPAKYPALSFTSATQNSDSVTMAGPVDFSGSKSVSLTLQNGDTSTSTGFIRVVGHPELEMGTVPDLVFKRLDGPAKTAPFPHVAASVIPDVKKGNQPQFTLSGPALPAGIVLRDDMLAGYTDVQAKTYGPYTLTISDFSGDTDQSNPFNVIVEPRDEIEAVLGASPVFDVEVSSAVTSNPVTYVQPFGARDFTVTYTLNGSIPSWMSFDTATGTITAAADIPYSEFQAREIHGPFTITVEDQEGSKDTSDPFEVRLREKASPKGDHKREYKGNVTGRLQGEDPTPMVIATVRSAIDPNSIYGTPDQAQFLSVDPSSPAGLTFDPATGILSGQPTEEFNGKAAVKFKDTKNREGTIEVPLTVIPYPAPRFRSGLFEIPRLSNITSLNISPDISVGFWNNLPVTWEVDTTRGPDIAPYGLSIRPLTGQIIGRTKADEDTVITGVVLKATTRNPNGNSMSAWTPPIDLKVVAPTPLELSYAPDEQVFYMLRDGNGNYSLNARVNADPVITGSYEPPLRYTVNLALAYANGLDPAVGINPTTGYLSGIPTTLGKWGGEVTVTDNEGTTAANGPFPLRIKTTLAGNVEHSAASGGKVLRIGEPFKTSAVAVSNEVRPIVFTTNPANIPATAAAGFDVLTGAFSDLSTFETPVSGYKVEVMVKDAHDRQFNPSNRPTTMFNVKPRLGLSVAQAPITGQQYSATSPIAADIKPVPSNVIGTVSYSISGDVPGTAVSKNYLNGELVSYTWTDAAERDHVLGISSGTPTSYTVDGIAGSFPPVSSDIETTLWQLRFFPADSLFFDTITGFIKGIPSKAGTFTAQVTAFDSHANDYIRNVASRITNNTSEPRDITFEIAPAEPLGVANNAGFEQIEQYTSQPTLTATLINDAYGFGIAKHARVSGTLPNGVTVSPAGSVLRYRGYPTQMGTFGGNVWMLTDAAGRQVPTDAVTVEVGPRTPFEIVSDNPIQLPVNVPMTVEVSTKGNAFGTVVAASDWNLVNVTNIPDGMTYTVADGVITFAGTATTIGTTTGMRVTATDSLGTVASADLNFEVLEPSGPIDLSLTEIATKVGYPYEMQPTHSNTYGKVRYYSYDITGELAGQLSINGSTGLVSGTFSSVGDRDIDVYVTDATNRVTSKPLIVKVMPNIRLTVPEAVPATQGKPMDQFVQTDYVIGKVTYETGGGVWPEGVSVDPATGNIVGYDLSSGTPVNLVTTAAGRYENLTIKATDTFDVAGVTYTDVRYSNPFALLVAPVDASPDVIDPANLKVVLGEKDTAINPWRVTVNVLGSNPLASWNYAGTTYTPSHDLTQYGLAFDTKTGTYSGTPTSAFIVRDFTMRVTSQRGDTDVTAPFWIGVAPTGPITLSAAQKLALDARTTDATFPNDPLQWQNVIGNLINARVTNFATLDVDPASGSIVLVGAGFGNYPPQTLTMVSRVTDEFGRTAQTTRTIELRRGVTVATTLVDLDFTKQYASEVVATAANIFGTVSWSITGLPAGLSYDPSTGAISGQIDSSQVKVGDTFTITLKATDSLDGNAGSTTVSVVANSKGNFIHTEAAQSYSCGLTASGTVKCWGTGSYGTLGNGSSSGSSLRPTNVLNLGDDVSIVRVGGNSACAITDGGAVKCWGMNANGKLALPTIGANYTTATAVPSLSSGVKDIALSPLTIGHACALMETGGVKCWGFNQTGQVGIDSAGDNVTSPVDVVGLQSGVTQISVGMRHSCALLANGSAKCWGQGSNGVLGNQSTQSTSNPVDVTVVSGPIKKISAGNNFTCALLVTGSVNCWGSNSYRNLGDHTFTGGSSLTAKTVSDISNAKDLNVGYDSTCAHLTTGGLLCWGRNDSGQNGEGYSSSFRNRPTAPLGLTSGVRSFSGKGFTHGCATLTSGRAVCWGTAILGDGKTTTTNAPPTEVDG